ncbi:TIGR03364 family FAD-dependent oxidoreductase [Caballeronia mineralivorans]|jgi:FAD dependent oxidoreductase TIGR03364|uniref:TIGR03364 family FAD-dependent oxidoreductase n=1 Tax=Caballeronia mineralivorans TaxID=2010198 RepID=UPI0023F050E5|nr:TIGR03364 family FAD-dependent oxidoreductase [Caballeronia mineralivorans]
MTMTTTHTPLHTDVAIIGAGILGLAHAYAFAKRGLRVTVFERSGTPVGASIRNFGMVLVTGQAPGAMHALAQASREIWLGWAAGAALHVRRSGSLMFARSEAEARVMESFAATRAEASGYDAALLSRAALDDLYDGRFQKHRAALHGRADLQVFSREAVPALIDYLRRAFNVDFRFGTLVQGVDGGLIETTAGAWRAEHVVVCAGHDYLSLLAPQLAALEPRVCRLQMLRVRPATPFALDHAVLTGLSCLHYGAFSDLPEAAALHAEVAAREPALLEHGIHFLASPTPDGGLIVGDSHDYGDDPSPFNTHAIDEILFGLAENTLGSALRLIERWQGVYGARTGTSGAPFSVLRAGPNVTGVYMHSGIGMSIGPALGDRVVSHLLDGAALPAV